MVIGNASYANTPPLKNPVNDARDIAKTLKSLGFEVIEVEDAGKQKLDRAIVAFGAKLAQGGTALFFYSGHGLQVNGRNYLVPVDASLATEGSLRVETTDVDLVMDQMQVAQTRVNLVILDACRNNPFERRFRSLSRGLAPVNDAPQGTLIAYATSPGRTAADGTGPNGLYTAELLKAVATPGLKAEDVFKTVRVAVTAASKGAQTPWEASSLTGDFYFKPGPPPAPSPSPDSDTVFWQSVMNSSNIADFRAYLARFANGIYAKLAQERIALLSRPPPTPAPTPPVGPTIVPDEKGLAERNVPFPQTTKLASSTGAPTDPFLGEWYGRYGDGQGSTEVIFAIDRVEGDKVFAIYAWNGLYAIPTQSGAVERQWRMENGALVCECTAGLQLEARVRSDGRLDMTWNRNNRTLYARLHRIAEAP